MGYSVIQCVFVTLLQVLCNSVYNMYSVSCICRPVMFFKISLKFVVGIHLYCVVHCTVLQA